MIVHTYETRTPLQAARHLGAILAVDYGVQSRIERDSASTYRLVADDGKVVCFTKKRA